MNITVTMNSLLSTTELKIKNKEQTTKQEQNHRNGDHM